MLLTLGNWILVGLILIAGIIVAYLTYQSYSSITPVIITAVVTALVCVFFIVGVSWWHSNTAEGARAMKDYQSNMANGIDRHLQIIADDGMVIYEREGKFDVEMHDDYVVFDEKGERTIIYRSYTATMVIEEPEK